MRDGIEEKDVPLFGNILQHQNYTRIHHDELWPLRSAFLSLSLCTFKRKTSPHSLVIDNNARGCGIHCILIFRSVFPLLFIGRIRLEAYFLLCLLAKAMGLARLSLRHPGNRRTKYIMYIFAECAPSATKKKSQLYLVSRSSGAELVL